MVCVWAPGGGGGGGGEHGNTFYKSQAKPMFALPTHRAGKGAAGCREEGAHVPAGSSVTATPLSLGGCSGQGVLRVDTLVAFGNPARTT
jgi:hypothetical protein